MKIALILLIVLSMIVLSCNTHTDQPTVEESGLIEISKEQFESESMLIGGPSMLPFTEVVHVTGSIIPSVGGKAQLSLALPGVIIRIHYAPGHYISKGSVMFDVAGNEFIDLQKDFAESAALVTRLKSEYLRVQALYKENIASLKDYSYAESSFYAENAKYNALKIKLENLRLDVSKIEKGEFYLSYTVHSPISGFVSNISATLGQYVEPQEKIAEIINNESFQLRFTVFEKDMHKIKAGQTVAFSLNGNAMEKQKAVIETVGRAIISESKAIECFALIENPKSSNIVSNQFVEGEVYIAVDTVPCVPETAIVFSESDSYLLLFESEINSKYYFKKLKVTTGRKFNNFVELTEQLPSSKLLINGIYNIQVE